MNPQNPHLGEAASPLLLSIAITDTDVAAALNERPAGRERDEFALACLKIGVQSLRLAKGTIDTEAVRNAGDHLIAQLGERLGAYRNSLEENVNHTLARYFDPASGLFSTRVASLTSNDGDLNRVLQNQVSSVQQELGRTLERFLGENSSFLALLDPSESNRFLAAMRQSVDGVLQAERAAIVGQFSLDEPNSALSRLVRELTARHGDLNAALASRMGEVVSEFSLDREDSALSRLVARVESAQRSITQEFSLDNAESALSRLRRETQQQLSTLTDAQNAFHKEVIGMLSALAAKREAESRSTTHGAVFEEAVGERLRSIGTPAGDIVEDCGTTTGQIRNSKVGDFTVTLPPESAASGARIVIEAKESGAYSLKSTLEEADEARRNRGAGICLFVHSARTAPVGLEPISKFGNDVVIVWDAESPEGDIVFRAGYLTAKALSIRASQRANKDAASFEVVEKAIEGIRKAILGFDEMKTTSETIQNGALKMLDRMRIMRNDLERQASILNEQVSSLKAGDAA